jgi:hypothetical protein
MPQTKRKHSRVKEGHEVETSKRFARLARAWRKERSSASSDPAQWAMCLSYQKIIGLGPPAVSLILAELKRKPDHWFWALHALTDVDPIRKEHRGKFTQMVNDWLSWGAAHGYVSAAGKTPVSKQERPKQPRDKRG